MKSTTMMLRSSLAACSALLLAAGCSSTSPQRKHDVAHHVLEVSGEGLPTNERGKEIALEGVEFQARLDSMRAGILNGVTNSADKITRVVVFAHGGLNSREASWNRALAQQDEMRKAGVYPIFIHWDSGLFTTLGSHLFTVRQGQRRPVTGVLTFPFVLASDLARAVVRIPMTYYHQAATYFAGQDANALSSRDPGAKAAHRHLLEGAGLEPEKRVHISPLPEKRLRWRLLPMAGDLVQAVIGAVFTPVVLDGLGKGAWDIMLRRTQTMFTAPGWVENSLPKDTQVGAKAQFASTFTGKVAAPGSVPRLLRTLADVHKVCNSGGVQRVKFQLVGHSMGAIVACHALGGAGLAGDAGLEREGFRFDDVVFMAAACTFREWMDSVLPYLHRHPGTKFYSLSLHPQRDASESMLKGTGIMGNGSLLEQIDNIYSSPNTPTERTFGKWQNLMNNAHLIPPSLYPRVHLKVFPWSGENVPTSHGEVDLPKVWWQEWYWIP